MPDILLPASAFVTSGMVFLGRLQSCSWYL